VRQRKNANNNCANNASGIAESLVPSPKAIALSQTSLQGGNSCLWTSICVISWTVITLALAALMVNRQALESIGRTFVGIDNPNIYQLQ